MTPFGKLPVAAAEIVINNSFVASFIEDFIGVGTDVTGSASDEYHEFMRSCAGVLAEMSGMKVIQFHCEKIFDDVTIFSTLPAG